jgi:uncharacterized membrane protein YqgA involved in biofilm formation
VFWWFLSAFSVCALVMGIAMQAQWRDVVVLVLSFVLGLGLFVVCVYALALM